MNGQACVCYVMYLCATSSICILGVSILLLSTIFFHPDFSEIRVTRCLWDSCYSMFVGFVLLDVCGIRVTRYLWDSCDSMFVGFVLLDVCGICITRCLWDSCYSMFVGFMLPDV